MMRSRAATAAVLLSFQYQIKGNATQSRTNKLYCICVRSHRDVVVVVVVVFYCR